VYLRSLIFNRRPVLAKGIHRTRKEVEACLTNGAKYVLTYDYYEPDLDEFIIVEPSSFKSLLTLLPQFKSSTKMLWNSRDLHTGEAKHILIPEIRKYWHGWLCQASKIQNTRQVYKDADAFLVGEHLPSFYKESLLK
jgi:hypothetical protein